MEATHEIIVERLDEGTQEQIVQESRYACRVAPPYRPEMPAIGTPFRYEMTCMGNVGWLSDCEGYRYVPAHPYTGDPWPPIPEELLEIAARHGLEDPDTCLVNIYRENGALGLHRDTTEFDRESPVVSVSLGATGIFLLGGLKRKDPVERIPLESGDVVALGGPNRMAYHGVAGVLPWTSPPGMMKDEHTRISLTLRRVFVRDR